MRDRVLERTFAMVRPALPLATDAPSAAWIRHQGGKPRGWILLCALVLGAAGCALGPWKGWITRGPQMDLPTREVHAMAFGDRSLWLLTNAGEGEPSRVYKVDPLVLTFVGSPIPVGRGSTSIRPPSMAASEGAVWVPNRHDGTVSRVDTQTNQVVATVPVEQEPRAVAFGEGAIWVLSKRAASKIDPQTNQVIATIMLEPTGSWGPGVAVGGGSVWIEHFGPWASTVVRIDSRTRDYAGSIRVPWTAVSGLRLGFGGGALWVSDGYWAARIDPATGQIASKLSICVGGSKTCGGAMALHVSAESVWIVGSRWVFRLNPRTNTITERFGVVPEAEAVAVGEDAVWMLLRERGPWAVKPQMVRFALG